MPNEVKPLKSCPFCGSEGTFYDEAKTHVRCSNPYCSCWDHMPIEQWNTRATPHPEYDREELLETLSNLDYFGKEIYGSFLARMLNLTFSKEGWKGVAESMLSALEQRFVLVPKK